MILDLKKDTLFSLPHTHMTESPKLPTTSPLGIMFVGLRNTNPGSDQSPPVPIYTLTMLGSKYSTTPCIPFMTSFYPLYCHDPLTPEELPSSVVGITRNGTETAVCRVVPHVTRAGGVVTPRFELDHMGPRIPVAIPKLYINLAFENGIVVLVWINKGVHVAFWGGGGDGNTSEAVFSSTQPDGAWEVLATRVAHGVAIVLASCKMPNGTTRHWVVRFDHAHSQQLDAVQLVRGMDAEDDCGWTITSGLSVVAYSATRCIAWRVDTGGRITNNRVTREFRVLSQFHHISRDYFVVLAETPEQCFVLLDLSRLGAHSHPLHGFVRKFRVATMGNACTDGERLCQCIKEDGPHYRATVSPIEGMDAYSGVYVIRPEREVYAPAPIFLGNSVIVPGIPPTRICRGLPRVAAPHHQQSSPVNLAMPEPAPSASTAGGEEDEEVVQIST
jgi:hypothetical protein